MLHSYVAFDLETTGLSVEENCIIEIGALKVRHGAVAGRFITFVKPEEPISERITEITVLMKQWWLMPRIFPV